jgi:hypothetical protein
MLGCESVSKFNIFHCRFAKTFVKGVEAKLLCLQREVAGVKVFPRRRDAADQISVSELGAVTIEPSHERSYGLPVLGPACQADRCCLQCRVIAVVLPMDSNKVWRGKDVVAKEEAGSRIELAYGAVAGSSRTAVGLSKVLERKGSTTPILLHLVRRCISGTVIDNGHFEVFPRLRLEVFKTDAKRIDTVVSRND